jgi:hypothetical protein
MPEPVKKRLGGAYYCPEAMPMLLAGYYQDLFKNQQLKQEEERQQEAKFSPAEEIREYLNKLM